MLTIQDAAVELIKVLPDRSISTASEIDDFFIFSVRPKNTPFGTATGLICQFVDKKTGEVTPHMIVDPIIFNSKKHVTYNPITLKEE